jgi:hypothetical protein
MLVLKPLNVFSKQTNVWKVKIHKYQSVIPTHQHLGQGNFAARSLIDINNHKTVHSAKNVNTCPLKLQKDSILGFISQVGEIYKSNENNTSQLLCSESVSPDH